MKNSEETLHVQEYLKNNTIEDLSNELAIKATYHNELPLVILNYDQFESPKTHPVTRECRGLVLNCISYEVVARPFFRFFNWGEVENEMHLFDFSSVTAQSKEDGSLCLLYYCQGRWRVNTRSSFAQDKIQSCNYTWEEVVCKAIDVNGLSELEPFLDKNVTYITELCSPWNKVVRLYNEPCLYLLTGFYTLSGIELTQEQCDELAQATSMLRPTQYNFSTIEEIKNFLQEQSENDPTYEGIVICDQNGQRWKIKSPTYLSLHKMRQDTFNPKYLLPFVLTGEDDELLLYFPEVKETYFEIKSKVYQWYAEVLELWCNTKDIEDQKEFALKVKDTPFASILFTVRKKYGKNQTPQSVREVWRNSEKLILKYLT